MVLVPLVVVALGLQIAPAQSASGACATAGAQAPESAELCLANDALRRGEAAPKDSAQRTDLLESAAGHYRRAATLAREPGAKARVLDALATALDAKHLNEPANEESVLRELLATVPSELAPMFRLADLQEHQEEIDGAEDTLLAARRSHADDAEPYKKLTQFYARRVAAMQALTVKEAHAETPQSGTRDDHGVFQVGGGIRPPVRDDRPIYPPEAKAAGVTGVVIVEILIDTAGSVADAKVVRSIPLLDDEAIRAVRQWHFAPTIVNGEPVPVRMNLAVSFTDR